VSGAHEAAGFHHVIRWHGDCGETEEILTLSDAANIGQVFAALGVILSLIFIGWQVRQNTKSLRSSTLQRNTDLWFGWFALVADPRFAVVYAKGSSGRDLDQTEFSQFFILCRALFMGMEDQHYQYRHGLLDSDAYRGYEIVVREQIIAFPGIRAMWQLTRHSFGADFVSFIDKLIAETSVDQKSVHKDWSELIAARRAAM